MVMSGLSVNLTTLFLGRLRPLKRLTSTQSQELTAAFLNQLNEEKTMEKILLSIPMEVCAGPSIEPSTSAPESDALPTALRGPAANEKRFDFYHYHILSDIYRLHYVFYIKTGKEKHWQVRTQMIHVTDGSGGLVNQTVSVTSREINRLNLSLIIQFVHPPHSNRKRGKSFTSLLDILGIVCAASRLLPLIAKCV